MAGNMLDVYTIVETNKEKNRWTKIGVAFVNRDQSLNVKLDALPINGALHIRERRQQQDDDQGGRRDRGRDQDSGYHDGY